MTMFFLFLIAYFLLIPAKQINAQTRPFRTGGPTPEAAGPTGDVATLKGLEAIFYNVVAVVLAIAGIVLFIMLIIGGFKYMSAGADQQKTQAARQTLTYAIIGLVVIVSAFLILRLIENLTGVPITTFRVTTQ